MYLRRKIDVFLDSWKSKSDPKSLIVKDPRQVGKTESIRRFADKNYKSFIEINFVEKPNMKHIIENGYKVDEIIKLISLIEPNYRFIPKETLIFFDELQAFPELATALKFFKIDGRYDVICSGSLLGIDYQKIESNSVGYKIDYELYSMDFEEFLWAKGFDEERVDDMLMHMIENKPFSNIEMDVYYSLFADYCIVGGMPDAVRNFIESNVFSDTVQIQQQIIQDYKEDIQKYVQGIDQTRILNVYKHIPVQLARENKKFQISKVSHGARFREYFGCVNWLEKAGIINICYCLNDLELPIKGNYDEKVFKVYFNDTGLLVSQLDEESQFDFKINKNFGVYKGALYESVVSDALKKSGYELYYYKKESGTLEIDFVIRSKDNIVPIEVKAGNAKAKSLIKMIESNQYKNIEYGIKFAHANIGYENNVYTFPYFCAFLLHRYMHRDY